LENTLAVNPDINDLASLTEKTESGTLKFMKDIMAFLATLPEEF